MSYNFFIAKRYFFSKESKFISFITYISIIGIALGVATLIIATSILNGFEKEIKDKVAGLVSHIQITSFAPEGLEDYREAIDSIKNNVKGITGISPIVQKEAVVRGKNDVEGILLKGIVPESNLSSARQRITEGEFNLSPIDSIFSRLIIGDKLAKKLNLSVNDKVIVFGLKGIPSPLNQPKIKQFRISGIYETGLKEYDDVVIYTDLSTAQDLFDYGKNISGIEITVDDLEMVEEIVYNIKQTVGYPYYPKSLFKLYKGLFTWVELQKAPTPIVLGLIIIVATFNIVGTLLMLVLEKTRSIGILKSLGASRSGIMKIFLFNGLLIGAIGIFLGNVFGLGLCFLELKYHFFKLPEIYYMKAVPILLDPLLIVFVSVIAIALTFLATLIPSYLASRLNPVKSITFN